MNPREFAQELEKCEIALFDLDNTTIDGNASAGVVYGYLGQELGNKNLRNVAIGLWGGLQTEYYRRTGREQTGLKRFVAALNKAGCADNGSAYSFAYDYVEKHGFDGFGKLVECLEQDFSIAPVVYTGGLEASSRAAKSIFRFYDSFANYMFNGNLIVPSRFASPENPSKLDTAERYLQGVWEVNLSQCLVVGDAETDMPVMERAGLSLASPKAKPQVREAADFWTPDYGELHTSLKIHKGIEQIRDGF